MPEKPENTSHANGDDLFHNEDFDKVTFIVNQRRILAVDLIMVTIFMKMILILQFISEF